jgi:hypothetical protein
MATKHEQFVKKLAISPVHGAILLFAPQIKLEKRYTRTMAEKTEEIAITAMSETEDITISKLAQELSKLPSGSVVLFTGTKDGSLTKVVVGVYFPGPMFSINETSSTATKTLGTGGIRDDYHRYLLFQLQPVFRLFRGDSRTALSKIIHSSDPIVSFDQVETDTSEALRNMPYWIGKPKMGQERNSCLDVDPESRTVRLVGQTSSDGVWYGGAYADGQSLEVMVKCCMMDILAITGGLCRGPEKEEIQSPTDILKGAQDEAAVAVVLSQSEDDGIRLDREELSKRIEGFGSGGKTIKRENVELPS